jgi:hypothetical protein
MYRSCIPFSSRFALTMSVGILLVQTPAFHASAQKPQARPAAPMRFRYDLIPGKAHRYRVFAHFHGLTPPFIEPVTLRIQFDYLATVKKQDDKGAQIEFTVDKADLVLLARDPGPEGKVSPDEETPFPLPLSQVQSALNITATLRPDGTLVALSGGDSNSSRIQLGLELRKLFLLVMPVVFPDRPVKLNDEWAFDEGILGKSPGRVTYKGKLVQLPNSKQNAFVFEQQSRSKMDEKKDKAGKITEKAEDVVETTSGEVTFGGTLNFVSSSATRASGQQAGRLKEGRMLLNAQVLRKRTIPDPDRPEDPLETKIDLKGWLRVQQVMSAPPKTASSVTSQPAAAPAQKKALGNKP